MVTVIAVAALLGPVLGTGPAMTEARVRRGRQLAVVGTIRAGADIALIVLAVLAGWQLRRYSAGSGSGTTIDPVLALAPALALAGGTVVTLRLLPFAARAGDRLAGRGRRLTASLAGWQASRQPLRQGGAALLLVMAVATGTLALAQHASWTRSASDQGSFAAGADARVDTPIALTMGATGEITNATDVQHAMAVYVQPGASPAEVLAIDAAQAAPTVQIRSDQTAIPAAKLFAEITPKSAPGVPEPGRPDAVTFTAALVATGVPGQGVASFRSALARRAPSPGSSGRSPSRSPWPTARVTCTSSTPARWPPTAGSMSWWLRSAAPMSATRCAWSRSRSRTSCLLPIRR